jgi:ABC-type branched-subunit amino acid transport system ATPase component
MSIAVEARGLVKRFGEIRAVDGVNLRVDAPEIRGLAEASRHRGGASVPE